MAKHSSEHRVCRTVSSSNYSRCPLLDSSCRRLASVTVSDKPWAVSSATSRARCTSASSPSRRATFQTMLSISSHAEARAMILSSSTLDTLSRASFPVKAARSSASLTNATALSNVAVASATSTATAQAASAVATASHAWVTSTNNVSTSALPQDRCCRNKDRRK
jgi:hypothetical protein